MKSNYDIKEEALKSLNGKWGTAAVITLIYGVITLACSSNGSPSRLYDTSFFAVTFPLSIVGFFISGALALGFASSFLKIIRNQEVEVGELFAGFKKFWKAFVTNLLRNLIIFVWMLLVLIPLIGGLFYLFSGLGASFSDYNGVADSLRASLLNHGFSAFGVWILLIFLSMIPAIIVSIDYSLVFFVLNDEPEIDALSALQKSKKLMKGYRLKFFLLGLSFIGWLILSAFTLFLGLLLLIPYITASYATFYEERKAELSYETREFGE